MRRSHARAARLLTWTPEKELEVAYDIQEGDPAQAAGAVAELMNAHMQMVRDAAEPYEDTSYHDDVLEAACIALQFAAFTFRVPEGGGGPRFRDHARPLIDEAIAWAVPRGTGAPELLRA